MKPPVCLAVIAVIAVIAAASCEARAQEPPDAGPPQRTWTSCVENVPPGASRPKMIEAFPDRGFSGYVSRLEIIVEHGQGETVLPEGFRVRSDTDAARALELSGFVIPDPDGGSSPALTTEQKDGAARTTLSIPFVPLPKEGGRHGFVLPPVPIAIARASGELITLCTAPHPILVEDPIANHADPQVKPNPDPRPQREDWPLARQLAIGLGIGIIVGIFAAWLLRRWLRRPRIVPVIPPKLPWIAALEELQAIRRSTLLAEGKSGEYFDRVSDCVRKYLGARYGFDGLESTTDEILVTLARVRPAIGESAGDPELLHTVQAFLADCDLVKFARLVPAEQDCLDALVRGERIVVATTPPTAARAAQGAGGASNPPPSRGKKKRSAKKAA